MILLKPDQEEREKIRKLIQDLAEYYSKTLSENQLDMYVDDLMEMGSEITDIAIKVYRRKWNEKQIFPLPAQLRVAICFMDRETFVLPRDVNKNIEKWTRA